MAFKSLPKSLVDAVFCLCERLFLCGCEIEAMNSTAIWAWMALGGTTREHDLKFLMTVRALNLLSDREVPFHRVAFITI